MKREQKVFLITLAILTSVIVFAILISKGILKVWCPFNLITGLNCPGCGNTRATIALLQFNIKDVFKYNLLYFLEVFYCSWVYFNACINYIKNGSFNYTNRWRKFDIAVLCAIFIWGIVRNITPLF